MSNDIVLSRSADIIQRIANANTKDEIKAIMKSLDDIKTILEVADSFRAQSIKYAQLEATALIMIAEKGMAKEIGNRKSKRRLAAEWLCTLSKEEQGIYIGMCADGLLIEQVYWREVGCVIAQNERAESAQDLVHEAINEFNENGIIDISQYKEWIWKTLRNPGTAADVIDGMRNKLRQAGGVGAYYSNTYVHPEKCDKEHLHEAIKTRVESILDDAKKIQELCEYTNIQLTHGELQELGGFWNPAHYSKHYFFYAWLSSLGVITDEFRTWELNSDLSAKNKELHYYKERVDWMKNEIKDIESKMKGAESWQ